MACSQELTLRLWLVQGQRASTNKHGQIHKINVEVNAIKKTNTIESNLEEGAILSRKLKKETMTKS